MLGDVSAFAAHQQGRRAGVHLSEAAQDSASEVVSKRGTRVPVVRFRLDGVTDNDILLVAADDSSDSLAALLARVFGRLNLHQSAVYEVMTNPADQFDEAYYMDGIRSGKSNYENYRWLGEPTLAACRKIIEYLGMRQGESIADIGAGRGYYVRAFRMLGMRAYGIDVSEWAVANADPLIREHMSTEMPDRAFDWANLKDLGEHLEVEDLRALVSDLNRRITKGMLFIVPLAAYDYGPYLRKEDEMDVTHVIRWTLDTWLKFLEDSAPGFNVTASYNIHGIKPASSIDKRSCGFLTLLRP